MLDQPNALRVHAAAISDLIATGRDFHTRGWSLGTSSNYSVVVDRDPLTLLLTGSGFDKGRLQPENFVLVGTDGRVRLTSFDFARPGTDHSRTIAQEIVDDLEAALEQFRLIAADLALHQPPGE
jgi:hypothetical protein